MEDYKVVDNSDYGDFVAEVKAALGTGWLLAGGVFVVVKEDGSKIYYQAVYKEV